MDVHTLILVQNLGILLALVLALGGITWLVTKKICTKSVQHELTANELMANFREMHSQGELSDAEFRTIKTTLAVRAEAELKDNGQQG